MKIIDKTRFKDKTRIARRNRLKHIAAITGVLFVFLVIWSILEYCTSPGSKTSKEDSMQQYAIVESSGGTYYGALEKALYIGEGTFQHIDGSVYVGEFSGSQREGSGTLRWANGDTFTGIWKNDQMVEGTYTFANGRSFNGTFKSNKWDKGYYSLGNTMNLAGFTEFAADIEDGVVSKLVFTMLDGAHYNGMLNGYAEICYADGNKYVGNVADGKRSGNGTFTWISNGAVYDGNWSNDQMEGSGNYRYESAEYPYITGTFKEGKLDGEATYYKEKGKSFKTLWSNGICTNNNK